MVRVGKLLSSLLTILALAAMVAIAPIAAHATITPLGDVDPLDPAVWDAYTTVNVGYLTGAGTVTVDNSGTATTATTGSLRIGSYDAIGAGTVIVTGAGAIWNANAEVAIGSDTGDAGSLSILNGGAMTVTGSLETRVGYYNGVGSLTVDAATYTDSGALVIGTRGGTGTLNIGNGGSLSIARETYVADLGTTTTFYSGVGSINFGAGGGSLSTRTLLAAPATLTGTGTIAATGIVTDATFTFDNNANKLVSYTANQGVGVTVDLNTDASNGLLGAGYSGNGSVTIANGVSISTMGGYLGYYAGASGTVTVQDGSNLTSTGAVSVGYYGAGILNIQNGSTFGGASCAVSIADYTGASGTMAVTDSTVTSNSAAIGGWGTAGVATLNNSTWTIGTGGFSIGASSGGNGLLALSNGSTATVSNTGTSYVGNYGVGSISVDGSTFTHAGTLFLGTNAGGVGTLNISNGSNVAVAQVYAGASKGTGSVNFGAGGGTLTTKSLYAPLTGVGTGNVVTNGLVTDNTALVFDSTASLHQTFSVGGVAVDLDIATTANNGGLGAGSAGTGTISVSNGVAVHSAGGVLGYSPSSSGSATVSAATWSLDSGTSTVSNQYYIGYYGNGSLTVSNGGSFGSSATNTGGAIAIGSKLGATGAVTVTGTGSALRSGSTFLVGDAGTGSLTVVSGGSLATYSTVIGKSNTGTGTVTLDGTTWSSSFILTVGESGNGTLNIKNGGVLTNAVTSLANVGIGVNPQASGGYGTGLVTVDGTGSRWNNNINGGVGGIVLKIGGGDASNASLRITNGGVVNSPNLGAIIEWGISGNSDVDEGSASILVDGAGSQYTTNKPVIVGYQGRGSLTISNGGYVTTEISYVGGGKSYWGMSAGDGAILAAAAGTLTVDGANSRILVGATTAKNLYVAYNGTGLVQISNGGAVTNQDCSVGGDSNNLLGTAKANNTAGTISISGNASTWTTKGTVYLGYRRSGTIDLDGGTMKADWIKTATGVSTASATINFNGGTLTRFGTYTPATWILPGLGTTNLYVKEGGAKFDTAGVNETIGLPLQHGGAAAIDGGVTKLGLGTLTLSGSNTYTGWTTVSGGTLSLGQAALYDASNVRVDTGTVLNLSYGSLTIDTIHYLFFGGLAQTAGTYNAANSGGFITGTGNLLVSATALQGDADLNGTVNSTDLGLLLSHYNQVGTGFAWGLGDFDANGTINSTDLGLLLSHYNQTSAATSAVPEPSTLLLLAAGLIGLLAYAWRKK